MDRYSRQSLFKPISQDGTNIIRQKTVLIVGMGALGTISGDMLARAGVKKLILIDRDYVETSNLQRQSLYTEADAMHNIPKVIAAKRALMKVRTDLEIDEMVEHADGELLASVIDEVDLIVDGTDNFDTRMVLNDISHRHDVPWIYAACVEASYASVAIIPGKTPCFRCLVPILPSSTLTCDTAGVIAPAVHMAVAEQVTYAIKILSEQPVSSKFRMGDIWHQEHLTINTNALHRKECETCGDQPSYPALNTDRESTISLCGRETVQFINDRSFDAVKALLTERAVPYKENPYFLTFSYEAYRWVVFQNGRMLLHGVSNINKAKTVRDQIFG